jgi:hypothetical protein
MSDGRQREFVCWAAVTLHPTSRHEPDVYRVCFSQLGRPEVPKKANPGFHFESYIFDMLSC